MTRARLHADFGGSPVWLPDRRVEWEELQVSKDLHSRLEMWVGDALHGTELSSTDRAFEAEGHELARLLSEELEWDVVYEG